MATLTGTATIKRPTRREAYDLALLVMRGVNVVMAWLIFVAGTMLLLGEGF